MPAKTARNVVRMVPARFSRDHTGSRPASSQRPGVPARHPRGRRGTLLILLLVVLGAGRQAEATTAGDSPPLQCLTALTARDAARAPTELVREAEGQVLIVDFWASWCTPCRKLMPLLDDMSSERKKDGLRVVAVNVDETREDAERFLARRPVGYPVVFDPQGRCAGAFGLTGMPSTYLVDRAGRVRHVHVGYREQDRAALLAAIEALLDEN